MNASKMLPNNLFLFVLISLACYTSTKACPAQELRRYQPSSPTVSPYLNLSRGNAGGLPNYYALVRPLNRQQHVNSQTNRLQRQQSDSLRQLERSIFQRPQDTQAVTGTGSRHRTLGNRAVYRDTMQFYPAVNLRR